MKRNIEHILNAWWNKKEESEEKIKEMVDGVDSTPVQKEIDVYTVESVESRVKEAIWNHIPDIHPLHSFIKEMKSRGYIDAHYMYYKDEGKLYISDGAGKYEHVYFYSDLHNQQKRSIYGGWREMEKSGYKVFAKTHIMAFTDDIYSMDANEDLENNIFFKNWINKQVLKAVRNLIFKTNNNSWIV